MAEASKEKACAHVACHCRVGDDGDFCGLECRGASPETDLACPCNHADCFQQEDSSLIGGFEGS